MEAVNAVGLTPLTVLSATRTKPRKFGTLHTTASLKNPTHANLNAIKAPTSLSKGLVLLSSVVTTGLANALTYEEALQLQEPSSSSSSSSADSLISDINGVFDGVINFAVENPAVAIGGVAVLALPLVLSLVLSKPNKAWGVETAKTAYAKLADDGGAQLLDIRAPVEVRQVGSPDIRGLKKKPVTVVYKGDDKLRFLNKLSFKFKEPENTTLFILDKFGGNSELVAELVTANGFKAAYAIKDGAEGPRGWLNSGLPWVLPNKAFSLDFGGLTDAIDGAVGGGADAVSVILGIAAATGLGLLAFSEVETALQLLGSAALVQVLSKKLLFADDRKKTLKEVDEFLNTKIAPKELVDEIKEIGKALLPSPVTSRALPATTDSSSTATSDVNDVPPKVEAVAGPAPEINSVPQAESPSENSWPLSPYTNYPDLKPPSSPMPSQP